MNTAPYIALAMVGLGGAAGSICRYMLGTYIGSFSHFPFGTLTVNVIACFVLGIVSEFCVYKSPFPPAMTLLLATGFCGGFSTFSAFILEIHVLLEQGRIMQLFLYGIASMALGYGALFCGMFLVGRLLSR